MSTQSIFPAVEAGDIAAVAQLLDADPGLVHVRRRGEGEESSPQRAADGQTPLQVAAMLGHLAVVKLLIDRGAEIYDAAQWGYPAVEYAIWSKQESVVEFFLGDGAKHPSMSGAPTFGLGLDVNLAARNGMLELVMKHLSKDKLAVYRRGVIGETPLHWSAHNGHLEIVRALLDSGADINADEIGCYGGKALHWASEKHPDIVRLLLERGADVNGRNILPGAGYEGFTPLIWCASQADDCAECAELLIGAGADVRAIDAKGRSAMSWSQERGSKNVAAVLRRHSGD